MVPTLNVLKTIDIKLCNYVCLCKEIETNAVGGQARVQSLLQRVAGRLHGL